MVTNMNLKVKTQFLQSYIRLDHQVVGVRMIDDISLDEYKHYKLMKGRKSYCQMISHGTHGHVFKVKGEQFSCDTSVRMTGIKDYYEEEEDIDGWFNNGFYETRDIAIVQKETVRPVAKANTGLVIGAMEVLDIDPEIVIVLCNPYQAMRLIHGYTYKYAFNTNVGVSGMCGVCFESTALPYTQQDISMSLLCPGSRANTGWTDDLMMVSFPISMLDGILTGLIHTANNSESDEYKQDIRQRLTSYNLDSHEGLDLGEAYFYKEES